MVEVQHIMQVEDVVGEEWEEWEHVGEGAAVEDAAEEVEVEAAEDVRQDFFWTQPSIC